MSLKMRDLVEQTGESKSTILYYVKEGLLPKPQKPKPNVHLYDESCINIIKFIKYLQKKFSYSISEIHKIFENNRFDFDNSFESLIQSIELIGTNSDKSYSKEEFLELTGITVQELENFIEAGYLIQSHYTDKELEVVKILKRAKEANLNFNLIDAYVKCAKELAILENKIGYNLLKDDTKSHNSRYELLFDLILNLKPYIFNGYTVKEHQKRINDEKSI